MAKANSKWTEEKLFKAFENYVEDFRKLNPKWIEAGLAQHLYESVYGLWRYIQSEEDTEISWEFPAVMLYFPVVMDWETFPDYPKRYVFSEDEKPEGPITKDSANSYVSLFSDGFFKAQKGDVLALVTRGIVWAIEGYDEDGEEIGRYILPPSIHEELEGLPEEEGLDKIEEMSHYGFEFTLGDQDSFFFEIHPLAVDPIKKEAYYRTFVGFNFHELDPKDLSPEQQEEFMEALLGELEKTIPKTKLPKRLRIEAFPREETMALPSHSSVMFPLFAIFAGKPGRLPRTLDKSYKELTQAERQEYDAFFDSVVQRESGESYDEEGLALTKDVLVINILSDDEEIRASAIANAPLFSGDRTQDINLAIAIKRNYGPEGLKHFYGFLWALDESIGSDNFVWDENEHLERLGYRRKKNGSFSQKQKELARRILDIVTSLKITILKKGKDRNEIVIQEKPLFYAGAKSKTVHRGKGITNQETVIYADPSWYGNAFENIEGRGAQYTPIFKKIAQVNYTKHPYVGILYGLLSVYWRMDPEKKVLTVSKLLQYCAIKIDKTLGKSLRELEQDLDYMIEEGFLKGWRLSNGLTLTGSTQPLKILEERITFIPPDWQREEIQRIKQGRGMLPATTKVSTPPMSTEEFVEILAWAKKTGVSQKEFAEKIGKSPSLITQYKSGKPISSDVADTIRKVFGAEEEA